MSGPKGRSAERRVSDARSAWEGRAVRGRASLGGGRRVPTVGVLAPRIADFGRSSARLSVPNRAGTVDEAASGPKRASAREWLVRALRGTQRERRNFAPTREGIMTTVVGLDEWIASGLHARRKHCEASAGPVSKLARRLAIVVD
jgi:hypothetical protein